MVISCVAYSCTNRQKTGSNISLFSGNLCRKCLCCVIVYVNECSSFENVLKYQYITDTFVFLRVTYIKCFPVVTLIGCNIKCYRGSSFINNVCVRVCIFVTLFKNSTRCQLINTIFFLYKSSAFNEALSFLVVVCLFIVA